VRTPIAWIICLVLTLVIAGTIVGKVVKAMAAR